MSRGQQTPGLWQKELVARGFELAETPQPATGGALQVSARCRHTFDTVAHGMLDLMVPVALTLHLGARGEIADIAGGRLTPADIAAAKTWLDDLIANHELDDPGTGQPQPRATHQVVSEADGSRIVRRRGFKAAAPSR